MSINTLQRYLLMAASSVLGILLLFEINSEGLEHSHWVVVTALVAILLFVAFSAKPHSGASLVTEVTSEKLASNRSGEGSLIVKARYEECKRQWEHFLKSSLVDRKPTLTSQDRTDLAPFMEMAAIRIAFANYLLIISHRSAESGKSEDACVLRIEAAGLLTYRLHEATRRIVNLLPNLPPPDRKDSLTIAAQQLSEFEILVGRCKERFRTGQAFPLDPLFAKLDDDVRFNIGDAASREAFFGIKYREETGRLLHPTLGIAG